MERIEREPIFEEIAGPKFIKLPEVGLIFNSQLIGSLRFSKLRKANYGPGFRMPTIPELVELVYASFKNRTYDTAREVVESFIGSLLVGNTVVSYFPEGIFVEDSPEIEFGEIKNSNLKNLEMRLGKYEENGVVFSDDGGLRFTPYNYKTGYQKPTELAENSGVIAIAGNAEKAEKLARVSEGYTTKPFFYALSDVDSPKQVVSSIGSDPFSRSFYLYAEYPNPSAEISGFSFGVLDNPNPPTHKK